MFLAVLACLAGSFFDAAAQSLSSILDSSNSLRGKQNLNSPFDLVAHLPDRVEGRPSVWRGLSGLRLRSLFRFRIGEERSLLWMVFGIVLAVEPVQEAAAMTRAARSGVSMALVEVRSPLFAMLVATGSREAVPVSRGAHGSARSESVRKLTVMLL